MATVVVKGGDNANRFDYWPSGNLADHGSARAGQPEQHRQFYGLSHLSFCWVDEPKVLGIEVEKDVARPTFRSVRT